MSQVKEKILILDDDRGILTAARMVLKKDFPGTDVSDDPESCLRKFRQGDYNLLLLDMNFTPGKKSGEEGLELIKKFLDLDPELFIIAITAYGDVDLAVKAMQEGASDFITKPWENDRLLTSLRNALKLQRSGHEIRSLRDQKNILEQDLGKSFSGFIGESDAMKEILRIIRKAAPTMADILILGENGTGKELVARAIHKMSTRSGGVFITVDLGTITESLFESELFGHKKGAFTDARQDRTGRFELAEGGTIFLDEIGNLPLMLQQKLLSAVHNRRITPVGSNQSVEIDARIISATNRDLHQMVKDGGFREDLLYRINTVEINLPPLRERKDDIRLLADYYLEIYRQKYNRDIKGITVTALKRLEEYDWPGNVRELIHLVERAVILSDGQMLSPADFPLRRITELPSSGRRLDDIERAAIIEVLANCRYNLTHAASELGMGRSTLYRKIRKYDIPVLQA
jgi:DNA-binding NtrC family response regulator